MTSDEIRFSVGTRRVCGLHGASRSWGREEKRVVGAEGKPEVRRNTFKCRWKGLNSFSAKWILDILET